METNKVVLGLLAFALLPACGAAQVPSVQESGAFDSGKRSGTKSGAPAIVWMETVENRGTSSLVAFHATFRCPQGKALFDYDYLFRYGLDFSISPGESVEIDAADPEQCPGGVDAAIFSDGHTEGDEQEVGGLYARRRGFYKADGELIELLSALVAQEKNPRQVMNIVANRCHALAVDQTGDRYETMGMFLVYSLLKSTLREPAAMIRTPSDKTVRQRTVDDVAKANNVSREQAQAMILIDKLKEWRADLEDHLHAR